MAMPVAAENRQDNTPSNRVARCLFGRPDPHDTMKLEKMEADALEKERKRVLEKYGVDLEELGRRDDIDVLIVPIPPQHKVDLSVCCDDHPVSSPDDLQPDPQNKETEDNIPQDLSTTPPDCEQRN